MIEVIPLTRDKYDEWHPLWQGYLTFYEANLSDEITKNNWKRFHDENEPVFALGAFIDGKLVGFVHYIFHRTNWSLTDACYLQDLYADPEVRGKGIGRALIEAVYDAARTNGTLSVYWITQEENKTARKLYDKISSLSGFVHYVTEL